MWTLSPARPSRFVRVSTRFAHSQDLCGPVSQHLHFGGGSRFVSRRSQSLRGHEFLDQLLHKRIRPTSSLGIPQGLSHVAGQSVLRIQTPQGFVTLVAIGHEYRFTALFMGFVYAAAIFSFLGGVWWGQAIARSGMMSDQIS